MTQEELEFRRRCPYDAFGDYSDVLKAVSYTHLLQFIQWHLRITVNQLISHSHIVLLLLRYHIFSYVADIFWDVKYMGKIYKKVIID